MANLVNACFGGSSESWTKQFPPNSYTCGYVDNFYYVSNFYNGVSPNDRGANGVALNPAFQQSYHAGLRRHERVRAAQPVQRLFALQR